jgi:hypothetical protein
LSRSVPALKVVSSAPDCLSAKEVGAAESAEILLGGVSIGWKYVIRAIYYLHFVRGVRFEHIRR